MAKDKLDLYESPVRNDAYFDEIPHVDARYRCVNNARQKNNDYIAALRALPTDEEIQKLMTSLPPFRLADRELSTAERILLLNTLDDLFFATARHVRLYRAVFKLINQGYAARREKHAASTKSEMQRIYDQMQAGGIPTQQFREHRGSQFSMSLFGASGIGKSSSMERLMDLFPPAIYHEKTGKWQLPILHIEMVYDGQSVHTLASVIFKALDDLLPGENYSHYFMDKLRMNANQRLIKALDIAHKHGVGLIFIDEAQNQRSMGEDRWHKRNSRSNAAVNDPTRETPLIKLLIHASNVARMPICFTGTLEAHTVLGHYFPRGRRLSGRGSGMWLPLEPSFDLTPGKRGEFEQATTVLWRYQWVRKPIELTPEMLDLFWELTLGLPDVMVKLFGSVQEAAMSNKNANETMSPQFFRAVYEKEFVAIHGAMEAMRSGDPDMVAVFPELWHPLESPKFRELWLARRLAFRHANSLEGFREDTEALRMARKYSAAARRKAKKQYQEETRASRLKAAVEDFDPGNRDVAAEALEALLEGNNPAGINKKAA